MTPGLDVVCLGNVTLDDIHLPDGRIILASCGGDAFYSGFGARYWTPAVGIVAPIGSDFPGESLALLRAHGVVHDGLCARNTPTIHNRVDYGRDGGRTFTLLSDPGGFALLSPRPADIPPAWLGARAFHIAPMELDAQEELAEHLAQKAGLVSLDLRLEYIAGNEDRLVRLIERVDILMPSHVELEALFGHDDLARAAREVEALGCSFLVVKMGERGSRIHDFATGDVFDVGPVATTVVDVTGAGDAYCGGFIAEFVRSGRLDRAAAAGAASAAHAIAEYGSLHMLTRPVATDLTQLTIIPSSGTT